MVAVNAALKPSGASNGTRRSLSTRLLSAAMTINNAMIAECPITSSLPNSKIALTKVPVSMIAAQRRTRGVHSRAKASVNSTTPAARM